MLNKACVYGIDLAMRKFHKVILRNEKCMTTTQKIAPVDYSTSKTVTSDQFVKVKCI